MKSESQPAKELTCPQEQVASPCSAEPAIIFEDNHLVVVIKPQNVPVCPDSSGDPNLLDQIKAYLAQKTGKARAFCGLVHRLDRVTGGVMVFAKTSKSAARLCDQIKSGEFEKTYLAAVIGTPQSRDGTLVNHLLKNAAKNTVEIVPSATTGAKRAELSFTVTNKSPLNKMDISLVEVKLVTGRSHQIRVQMAGIGCPVFGDAKYGGDKLGRGWDLALWAHRLVFTHPVTGDTMRFVVNPPETVPWTSFDFDRQSHKTKKEGK
jgi:23S rRNA pseudouridine1911/1915/1917 synthase